MDSTSTDPDISVRFSQVQVKVSLLERDVATLMRDRLKDKRDRKALEHKLYLMDAIVDSLARKLRSGHGSKARRRKRRRLYYPDNRPSFSTSSERVTQNQEGAAGTAQPTNRIPNSLRNRRERSPLSNSSDISGINVDAHSTRLNINAAVEPALGERPAKRRCSVSSENRPNTIRGGSRAAQLNAIPGGSRPAPLNSIPEVSGVAPLNAILGGTGTAPSNAIPGGPGAALSNAIPRGPRAGSSNAIPGGSGAAPSNAIQGGPTGGSSNQIPGGSRAEPSNAIQGGLNAGPSNARQDDDDHSHLTSSSDPSGHNIGATSTVRGNTIPVEPVLQERALKRKRKQPGSVDPENRPNAIQGGSTAVPPNAIQGGSTEVPPNAIQGGSTAVPPNAIQGGSGAVLSNAIPGGSGAVPPNAIQGGSGAVPPNAIQGGSGAEPSNTIQRGSRAAPANAILGGSNAGPSNVPEDDGDVDVERMEIIFNESIRESQRTAILADICRAAYATGMATWNTIKFSEYEKDIFLTRITSVEMARMFQINKCTTLKPEESFWPPILKELFPEYDDETNEDYSKWLARCCQKKKPLRYILETIMNGCARQSAAFPNVNNE